MSCYCWNCCIRSSAVATYCQFFVGVLLLVHLLLMVLFGLLVLLSVPLVVVLVLAIVG